MQRTLWCVVLCVLVAGVALAGDQPGQEVGVPGWIMTVISWFAQKWVVGFSVALAAALIPILQGIKTFLPALEGKLKPAIYWGILLLLGTGVSFLSAAADGTIQGEEWLPVITGFASSVAAFFGYKLVFSEAARARLPK